MRQPHCASWRDSWESYSDKVGFYIYAVIVLPWNNELPHRLPHICNEVDRLIDLNTKTLDGIPPRPSLDPLAEVLQLVNGFTREVSRHVAGDARSGRAGLVQALIASAKAFQDQLRGITPVFKPTNKGSAENGWMKTPEFLPKGETWPARSEVGLTYWLDDVVELAEGCVISLSINRVI
jgi:hypothetical protein